MISERVPEESVPSLYYEDCDPGVEYRTGKRTVLAGDIALFGEVVGDNSRVHYDDARARKSAYDRRIAHGMLGLGIFTGLAAQLGLFEDTSLALLGIEGWRFQKPVYPGDTIHGVFSLHPRRILSDGTRGIVERRCRLINQDGAVVGQGVLLSLVKTRRYDERRKRS